MKSHAITIFPSQLGWMAIIATGATVKQLTFGHRTAAAAKAALSGQLLAECGGDACTLSAEPTKVVSDRKRPIEALAKRLQAYALGTADDFCNVQVELGPLGQFQRRVIAQCQRIPYGATTSYAELAARAGHPGAARAVGNCMAANRIPLLIPCHRVVCADGRIGSYSAPGGATMKRRLLALESQELT